MLFSEPKIPQCWCWVADGCGPRVSVLFSEPKIPQYVFGRLLRFGSPGFSALQRAENSSIVGVVFVFRRCLAFQCSSASRKFLNQRWIGRYCWILRVSVLFSEPKIPQSTSLLSTPFSRHRFSALQRAENSSIWLMRTGSGNSGGFSALQRAENSSIRAVAVRAVVATVFQCSSASRKFLNEQYCKRRGLCRLVSVLFSEPKIPQFSEYVAALSERLRFQCSSASRKFLNSARLCSHSYTPTVSVLFSEPKIPQSRNLQMRVHPPGERFSALQRAENSSMRGTGVGQPRGIVFQCSSASRKFLNISDSVRVARSRRVSVLFSEPKIPQSGLQFGV